MKTINFIIFFLFSTMPYVYIGMLGDLIYASIYLYLAFVLFISYLIFISIKENSYHKLVLGNILNFISSFLFIFLDANVKNSSYFKPFSAFEFLIFIAIFCFILQIFIIYSVLKLKKF